MEILTLPLQILLTLIVGLIFGSFVSLVSYRLPRGENIISGRSRCPSCNISLGVMALVPLLSWIWQKGACRYCHAPVSIRYPLTEITQALLFLIVYFFYGWSMAGIILALFTVCLLVMTVVDLEWYIIPDEIQICMGLLGLLYHFYLKTAWFEVALCSGIGLAIGVILHYGYRLIRRKEGLGMGDVKFLVVAGIWMASMLTWVPFLFLSGVFGIILGIVWRVLGKGERFPFGPALAISLLVLIFLPAQQLFFNLLQSFYGVAHY